MTKIVYTGKQFMITIPKELVVLMNWEKGTEVILSKYPEKHIIYIEEVK